LTYAPSGYGVSNKLEYLVNAEWTGYEYAATPVTAAGKYTLDLSQIVVDHAGESYIDEWGYNNTKWHAKNVSVDKTCTWTINSSVEPEPETPAIDLEKVYRLKSTSQDKYLNVEAYNQSNTTGAKGSVGLAEYAENGDQLFKFEDAGNDNYYLKSLNGHYIVCRQWNVDACDNGEKSVLGIEFQENGTFYILNGSQYFKVGEVDGQSGVYYPYCDAPTDIAELWTLEEATVPTGINGINAENAVKGIYDLQGRKVEKITEAGIYIVDGKKVLVK
jgi:hypothetical protein